MEKSGSFPGRNGHHDAGMAFSKSRKSKPQAGSHRSAQDYVVVFRIVVGLQTLVAPFQESNNSLNPTTCGLIRILIR